MCSIGGSSTAGDGDRRAVGVGVTLLLHATLGWAAWTGLDTPAQTVPVPLEVRFIEAPQAPGPVAPVAAAPLTPAEPMPPPAAEPPPPEPLARTLPEAHPEPEPEPEPMPEPESAVASPVAEHEAVPRVERAPAPPRHARKKPPAKPKPMRKVEARSAIVEPPVDDPRPIEKVGPRPVDPSPVVAYAQPAPAPAVPAPAPAAAAPMLAAAAPAVPLRAPRFDAAYLRNPPPAYPRASRRLGEEGRVVLRVRVESDGRPSQLAVQASSGSARLDDAAFDAVRRWRFVAARRGDESVAAWVLVPIEFRLNDS